MPKKETAVENAVENEVIVAQNNLPIAAISFEEDSGAGIEQADSSSFAIPFITMLQAQSPAVVDETVEGAKAGLFINSITNELYVKVSVIPTYYQRRFLRWSPRSKGGGYKGEFSPIDVETNNVVGMSQHNGAYLMDVTPGAEIIDKDGHPNFDHLADTRMHFVLAQSISGAWQPALLSLSSTQIKVSKRWMSRIQGIELRNAAGKPYNPPSFSHIYELSGVKQENAKGKWWGVEVSIVGMVEDAETYARAKAFHRSASSGAVEVSPPVQDAAIVDGEVNKF